MNDFSALPRLVISLALINLAVLCPTVSFASQSDPSDTVMADSEAIPERPRPLETVTIDSQEYPVPDSWQGCKLDVPPLSSPPLVMVPPQFVKDNGRIFLLPAARDAFQEMAEAATMDGITMIIDSGYRSAWYQKKIYRRLMAKGKSFGDIARYVAPPGYSEHMLGLAVDFVPSNWRFADSPVYRWLQENGERFGFSETYPESSENKRPWEPSHWRYHPHITSPQKVRKVQ